MQMNPAQSQGWLLEVDERQQSRAEGWGEGQFSTASFHDGTETNTQWVRETGSL